MKYLTFECNNCDAKYSVEFNEELIVGWEPTKCPFCGEDLDEDFLENNEDEELDEDYDDEEEE
jgi:hypothetical protein